MADGDETAPGDETRPDATEPGEARARDPEAPGVGALDRGGEQPDDDTDAGEPDPPEPNEPA